MHLTQVRLIVSDFAGMFAYYRDVIGLKPMFPEPNPPYAAFVPELGSSLCLHDRADLATATGGEVSAEAPADKTDRSMVALRVDDIDAYLAEVTERGGVVVAGPIDFGGRTRNAYLRDPEGNLLEIQQWLTTRSGEPVPPAS